MADLRLMQSDLPARLERLRRQTEREGWDPPENAPGAPPPPVTIDEPCRSLLRANDSPDVDMPLSINPYRGCAHACLFCEARQLEPQASAPAQRLAAIRALARAGVPVGVNLSPLVPLLNEPEIEPIIAAAARVLPQIQVDDSPDMTADPGTAAAAADRMRHRLEAAAALHGLALTPPALDLSGFRPPRAPLPRHAAHFEHRTGQGRLF